MGRSIGGRKRNRDECEGGSREGSGISGADVEKHTADGVGQPNRKDDTRHNTDERNARAAL